MIRYQCQGRPRRCRRRQRRRGRRRQLASVQLNSRQFLATPGIKPRAARSGSTNANHCAMLLLPIRSKVILVIARRNQELRFEHHLTSLRGTPLALSKYRHSLNESKFLAFI